MFEFMGLYPFGGRFTLPPTWAIGIRWHLYPSAHVGDTTSVVALPYRPRGRHPIAGSIAYHPTWAGGIRWQGWGIAHVGGWGL